MGGSCPAIVETLAVEEASDEDFAEEYYDQLKDVFGKQGLVPLYDLARVRKLIKHLRPTGRLLLLRVRNAEGRSVATGIYPAMNRLSHVWGNASYQKDQGVRPNEALHWYAMRYWKSRGLRWHDWGGGGEYKKKYGGIPIAIPWFFKSKGQIILNARRAAYHLWRKHREFMRLFHRG